MTFTLTPQQYTAILLDESPSYYVKNGPAGRNLLRLARLLGNKAFALQERIDALALLTDDQLAAASSEVNALRLEFTTMTDALAQAGDEYERIFNEPAGIGRLLTSLRA